MKLPSVTGQEIVKTLGKAGFEILRQRGSPVYLKHPDGRATVVPIHKGESVGRGLLGKILHDTDLTREEFARLL